MDWIEVNGTSLRYELSGGGDDVLVLVHEMGGTLDSWDQVMPLLSPGRRVLRHDWRGACLDSFLPGVLCRHSLRKLSTSFIALKRSPRRR